MQIEYRRLDAIRPYERNARKIPQRAIEEVAHSLREFGWQQPIVVDKHGVIVAGHTRYAAARFNGWTEAPVLVADKLTPAQIKAYRLMDNRSHEESGWVIEALQSELLELRGMDFSLASTGFEMRELGKLVPSNLEEAPEAQVDRAEELQAKWKCERGQVWEIGQHRLMCGDSTDGEDVADLMDGEKAECVFTSPPYAVGIDYGIYVDDIENLRVTLRKCSHLWISSVVMAGGYAVVNFGDIVSGGDVVGVAGVCEYPMALEHWPVFRAAGWILWSRRIWCKPGAAVGSSRHCIGSNRAASNFEHIWTWKAHGESVVSEQTTGDLASQNGWIDSTHGVKLGVGLNVHGAGMPLMPAEFSISNHSNHGGIVHEPFAGTGTTLVAAQQLNRRCFGMEIEPKYCAVILERMSAMGLTPKLAHNFSTV